MAIAYSYDYALIVAQTFIKLYENFIKKIDYTPIFVPVIDSHDRHT
jgi:hypothetical protein